MQQNNLMQRLGTTGPFIAGILVIVIAIIILQNILGFVQVRSTPPGWQIIRPPDEAATIIIEHDTVWTGGKDGLIILDRVTGSQIPTPGSAPPFGYVRQILRDRDGWIWAAHDRGLARFRNGSWDVISPDPKVPFAKALSLAERHDGTIVVGTDTDVLSYRDGGWKSLLSEDFPSVACAEVLLEDRNGDLWVGCGLPTHGGLYRLNGTSWTSFTMSNGLPHQSVRGITQTRDGTVWVATGYAGHGGAALYAGGRWSSLTFSDGLAGGCVRSVFEDDTGRMWIGSEYDGIAVGTFGSWKILTRNDGLAGNEIKMMTQDPDGTYWLGTDGGVSRVERTAAA